MGVGQDFVDLADVAAPGGRWIEARETPAGRTPRPERRDASGPAGGGAFLRIAVFALRAYGVAGAAHANTSALNLRYAWPSADWGSLPLEGGIEAAYKRDLAAAEDPDALRAELMEKLGAVRSPMRTAHAFGIEHMIDPRDTRPILCEWVEQAYAVERHQLGPRSRGYRP